MKHGGSRRRRLSVQTMLVVFVICSAGVGLLMTMTMLIVRPLDTPPNTSADVFLPVENDVDSSQLLEETETETETESESESETKTSTVSNPKRCATVEEMGEDFKGSVREESLKVRKLIQRHFDLNGASRVRNLPPEQFCKHGFVLGKASEAGFGNEMYKILTGAALSVMLNRSLIIGQTRHIGENILLGSIFHIPMFPLPWKKSSIFGDAMVV